MNACILYADFRRNRFKKPGSGLNHGPSLMMFHVRAFCHQGTLVAMKKPRQLDHGSAISIQVGPIPRKLGPPAGPCWTNSTNALEELRRTVLSLSLQSEPAGPVRISALRFLTASIRRHSEVKGFTVDWTMARHVSFLLWL